MCHCAPVLSIHNTASKTHRVGIGLRPGRPSGGALPENDSGCAPTARLSAESSDIYSRSTPPSNFEIGSSTQVLFPEQAVPVTIETIAFSQYRRRGPLSTR